jgi:uncharacterized membrane protein YphA (DoxX/SURF4 family)
MEKALFALSLLLGIIFLWTGFSKLIFNKQKLDQMGMKGFNGLPSGLIKLIGLAEVVGALVLIFSRFILLPGLIVKVVLLGFSILMISATVFHLRRKEYQQSITTQFLLVISLFIMIFI